MNCIFCKLKPDQILFENRYFVVIADKFPVVKGHLLVVSKRHFEDFFSIEEDEMKDLREIILQAKSHLDAKFSPDGYNLGMNCGTAAGQSIAHYHLHILPRQRSVKHEQIKGLREYVRELL